MLACQMPRVLNRTSLSVVRVAAAAARAESAARWLLAVWWRPVWIVGTGGNTAACQESTTQCSDYGLQTCMSGQWGGQWPVRPDWVCERYPPAACLDPTWAEWPMPSDQVDVTAGAPNLESYTDNGDGTVTDNVTGLMWQQVVSTTTYNWAQALAYCPKLTLAGHSDWRLPSRIELVSIVDLGVTSGVP